MAARWMRWLGRGALVAAWCAALAVPGLGPGDAAAAEAQGPRRLAVAAGADDPDHARVIVKYRVGSALARDAAGAPRHAARLGRQMALALEDGHVLGRRTQSLRARGLSSSALAARLAANPEVEWAVPVRRKTITAVIPNDPYFADGQTSVTPAAGQWYLRAPDATLVSAINAVGAWGITSGASTITVAVLDTGVRYDHPDFIKTGGASKLWPGYDFVSRSTASNDGGGRDADASDPGDWSVSTDSCGASDSSWHGTEVAGLIGAATDNGIGMASVGREVMVLPVRVLGKCGGFDDDIIAGMRWAAGLSSDPVPNPHPARVINLSLGSSGACSTSYRDAVAELTAAGVAVVVAAGNDAGRAVNEPANCPGAIAVSGVRHAGSKVGYSNLGPEVALAAPAGNCVTLTAGACVYPLLTTVNAGTTSPGLNTYSDSRDATLGTSFAAPLVAGTVGLMLSVDPRLTPAQIKTTLQATARAFPSVGAQEPDTVSCRAPDSTDQIECYCTTRTCGAGLLDAGAAVAGVAGQNLTPSAVMTISTSTPTVGTPMTLEGVSSSRSVVSYQWAITTGASRARFETSTTSATTTLLATSPGNVTVALMVTDATGASSTSTQALVAVEPPTVAIAATGAQAISGGSLVLTSVASAQGGRTIASYKWAITKGIGLASFEGPTDGSSATLRPTSAGVVEVRLTVTDSAGAVATTTQSITVVSAPIPAIVVSNDTPVVGTTVSLDGSGSRVDPARTVQRYLWSIVSGANVAAFVGSTDQSTIKLSTLAVGQVTVNLAVTDSEGETRNLSKTITVAAVPVVVTPTSSGGGAMSGGWLLGLVLAIAGLARWPARRADKGR